MKLHLPSGLRKALLACLAAVALPAASIPSTIASGIAAVFLIASQRAVAEGSLSLGTHEVNGSESYDSLSVEDDNAGSDSGGLKIGGDETVTVTGSLSGTQQKNLRISGGAGQIYLKAGGTMDGNLNVFDGATVYIGTGQTLSVAALGGNTGVFNAESGNATLKITGTAEQEGQKQTIESGVAVVLDGSAVQVLQESTIKGKLTLGEWATLKAYKKSVWSDDWLELDGLLEGTGTIQVGGTRGSADTGKLIWKGTTNSATAKLKFDGTGTLELHKNLSVSALSFAEGAQSATITRGAAVGETITLSLGTITVNNGGSAITIGINGGVLLDFSGITKSGEGKLTINLTGYTDQTEFQLFGSALFGSWLTSHQEDWSDYIDFQGVGVGKAALLDTSRTGYVTISATGKSYTYDGASDLTWQVGQDGGWTTGGEWENGGIVQFTATSGEHTVTLGGDVSAAQLEITQAGATYNFTAKDSGPHTITLKSYTNDKENGSGTGKSVTMNFGSRVTLNVTGDFTNHAQSSYTFEEKLTVEGKLQLWGQNNYVGSSLMTLKKGGEVGTLDVSWGGRIALGADLLIKGWEFENNGHYTWFEKAAETEEDVYVNVAATMTVAAREANYVISFGEGVGLKVSGSGTELTLTGDWTESLSDSGEAHPAFSGNLHVGEGCTLVVSGANTKLTASQLFVDEVTDTTNKGLRVADGATVTLTKAVNTGGNIVLWGGTLTLEEGGSIGNMNISWGGRTSGSASLILGNDLEIAKGFTNAGKDEGATLEIAPKEELKQGVDKVYVLFKYGEGSEVALADFLKKLEFSDDVTVDTGIGIGKTGEEKLTITDGGTLSRSLKIKQGDMEFRGGMAFNGDVVLAGGNAIFSGTSSSNTVAGNLEGTSGSLTLGDSASLTLNGGISGQFTNITLGSSSVLDVKSGTLDLTGKLSFKTGSKIKLNKSGQQITLTSGALSDDSGQQLAIELTLSFMGGGASDTIELFTYWTEDWDEFFTFSVENDSSGTYADIHVDGGKLVWSSGGMEWTGKGDGTWKDTETDEWESGVTPAGKDVRFTEENSSANNGEVKIDGAVTPKDVYVDGGTYTFTQSGTEEGGLNMTKDEDSKGGVLQVGGYSAEAKLTLKLKNTAIPEIQLEDQGTLVLAHDDALPAGSKIKFRGGVLEYSDTALTGNHIDVSSQVANTDDGSNAAVKVSVDSTTYGSGVTWGGEDASVTDNGGLTHALNELGIEKSGDGNFALEWKEDSNATHSGAITVTEGELQYKVHIDNSNTATLSGDARVKKIESGEKATLVLTVEGAGTLKYSGTLTGDGGVSLGGGKIEMSGNSSAFTGEIGLGGGTVEVVGNDALGGAGTTLNINTSNQVLEGDGAIVNAGQVKVNQDATLSGVTLAGTVSGTGALTAGDGKTAGLSGDISDYTSELKTGTSGTWKLSGKALEQTVTNAVSGSGTVEFDGDATYSGKVSGGVTLEGSSGTLTVTSTDTDNDATAKLKGTVTLGDQETQAKWKGVELVSGEITLANVELAEGDIVTKNGAKLYVNTATGPKPAAAAYSLRSGEQGGIVNVNGMEGSQLDGITINESGKLEGVKGTITVGGEDGIEVDVYLAGMNVGEDGKAAIVGDESEELTFNVQDPASMKLHIGASAAGAIAESFQDNGGEAILHVVENGSIGDAEDDAGKYLVLNDEAQAVLAVTGAEIERDEQGNIIITGSAADVYIVRDEKTLTGEDELKALETSKATLLSRETSHLTLSQTGTADNEDDITVNNLVGVRESKLTVENTADSPETDRFTVHFNNTKQDITQKDVEGDGEKEDVEGQDTSFYGSITAGAGVDVEKEGLGTFTVGGNYTLEDGDTTITAGRLVLQGDENSMEDLVFNYTGEPGKGKQGDTPKEEERGLVLADGGTTTVNGSITESTDKTGGKSDAIEIQDDSKLVLKGESDLKHASITGDEETGGGTVVLDGEDASLGLQGDSAKMDDKGNITGAQLSGVDVQLRKGGSLTLGESAGMDVGSVDVGEGSSLDVGGGKANHVDTLTGSGTLKSSENGELHVGGGKFSGTLAGAGEDGKGKAGTLAVADGVNFTLDNANSTGSKENAWGVELGKGANLTVDVSEKSPTDPSDKLTLGDVNLGDGTMTVDFGENPVNKNALEANIAGVGKSGTLDFHSDGNVPDGNKVNTGITVAEKLRKTFPDHVKFTGAGNFLKDREVNVDQTTGELTVTTTEAEENKFERALPKGSKNALAGATMVWDSLKNKTQFESLIDVLNNPTDYAQLVNGLITLLDNGQSAELESALGAVAGSSISVLGPALAEDLHRQLKAIRNRTTTMAGEVTYDAYDNLPIWHAWINGEGGYHKLDSDGGAPGYTLNNWGGTVGVDIDVTPQTTIGLAITAMYGDLKPSAADGATGNLDTAYLSAFLRATSGAWIHTLVVSGGLADVQLDRTVNYGAGSYHTKGSTDGYAVGAMYEVGYTRLVNKEGTVALQPVFNVEVRHASIKGYNETGSDAGLSVDDIGQDVVTFGMGARMQSIVGENAFNRTSIFEARLLVKADAGDRSGTAMNAMLHDATRAEVESAEVGAVGVEAGMGITIPLGSSSGSIFLDASVEWRKGWTSVDAAAGYRVNF